MDIIFFLRWYLASSLAGLFALPITFKVFRRLPDRGYTFSKPLGLLLVGYIFWFFGSLRFFNNDNSGVLAAFLIIAMLGSLWLKRLGFAELLVWLRRQRATVLLVESLFLVAFAGWTLVRAYNPDILGTEKPMEFMFINSILRSPALPPHDAWLSNHAISYYYFGYLLIALLARITSTPSVVAFNLGLALLFGLTATASHGLLMNLMAWVNKERPTENRPSPSLQSSFWPALLGPVMVLIVGNLYGPLELLHDNGLLANAKIPAVWYDFGSAQDLSAVRSLDDFQRKPGIRAGWVGLWDWLDLKQLVPQPATPSAGFQWTLPNWFFASRVVHDRNLIGVETEAIDEFPAFSFLLGDMHPHVLALPFVVLVLALAFEWLLTGRDMTGEELLRPGPTLKRYIMYFLLSSLLLGSLFFLNTWDFPVYWFLTVACFVVGVGSARGWRAIRRYWRLFVLLTSTLLIASLALYWPFLVTFQSQAGGILPNLIYPTRFQQSIVMFAPVLVGVILFLAWLFVRTRRSFHWRAALWSGAGVLLALILLAGSLSIFDYLKLGTSGLIAQLTSSLSWSQALRLLLERRLVDSLTAISGAIVIAAIAGVGLGLLKSHVKDSRSSDQRAVGQFDQSVEAGVAPLAGLPAIGMALVMILTGALLWVAPEFVYLRDNFGTRMNTLFKFYFQAWLLWGVAGAFGAWYVLSFALPWTRRLVAAFVAINLLLGSVYLIGGLPSKTGDFAGPPHLDGMAYFARDYPDDWAAIQWLDDNVLGSTVILEGSRGAYWIEGRSSRFSMATGLPTLMGWANHESQWRGDYFNSVASRQDDIRTIYQTHDWNVAQALLDKYDIQYVIVSSLEQAWYSPVFTAKFDRFMHRVFVQGDVVIYRR
jgi:YYY domain-containing protein